MPGVIIQGLRKSRVKNPLFLLGKWYIALKTIYLNIYLLDEIDKLASSSHHGDPGKGKYMILNCNVLITLL